MHFFSRTLIILMLFIVSTHSPLFCQMLTNNNGTLIVTYQTDQRTDRLDRIRFWLINEKGERTLYPKKDEFVTSSHTLNEITVVITHLIAGNYSIHFLVPNTDHFFEDVPDKKIELKAGEVVKIDQTLISRIKELNHNGYTLNTNPSTDKAIYLLLQQPNPFTSRFRPTQFIY